MREMRVLTSVLVVLFAGIVLGCTTFTSWLWPIAPLSIALLLYLLAGSERVNAFWLGQSFGFGVLGASFFWGFDALPLDWLGITQPLIGFLIVGFLWFFYSFVIGSSIGFFALCILPLARSFWLLAAAPVLWVAFEFLRAFAYSAISWGPGSVLGVDFSVGFAGYAAAWSSGLLWFSKFGGVAALSATVVVIASTLSLLSTGATSHKRVATIWVLFVAFCFIAWIVPSPIILVMNPGLVTVNGLRIVPVSTHIKPAIIISPEKRRTDSTAIANALRQALEQRPDIVILPEYARYVRREGQIPEALAADIRKSLKETKTLVVDSEPGYQNLNGGHPSIILIDGESGEVLKRQHKRYLIPLGEFLPYFVERALRLFGLGPTIDVVRENRTYAPSLESYASRVVEWHGIKFAALLCSESFSPFGYRSVSDGGADVLINLASHAFFRERSSIIFGETLAMALVHSAFTGKVYVQATNYGPSLAIYPRGKVPAP